MGQMFKKVLPIIIFFILNQHSLAVETVTIFEFTDEEMKTLQKEFESDNASIQ